MKRRRDWEPRLSAYLAKVRLRPYAFGEHDCGQFVGGAVSAMTGRNPARAEKGRYSTEAGAYRRIKKLGHDDMEGLLDSLFAEKPVAFAQRGDIVLADGIPGICIGGEALFVGQEGDREGLVRIPRGRWSKAWAV